MSKESDLADLACRIVTNLGASPVATAVGSPANKNLPQKWQTRTEQVHAVYCEKLTILDELFTQVSKAKSAVAARTWLTSHDDGLDCLPVVAIRYCRFMDVRRAASRFINQK